MAARRVEDLLVYQRAIDVANEVSAIATRDVLQKDFELRRQLRSAAASVPSHIAEGFGQKTDRHFAHYLYIARGTTQEVRAHLHIALGRRYIGELECREICQRFDEIARMLTGLIRHLERENRKRRG